MYLAQLAANGSTAAYAGSDIQLAQLAAARESTLIRLACPLYQLPMYSIHRPGASHRRVGELLALAQYVEESGGDGNGLGVWVTVSLSGNDITIAYFRDRAKTVPWTGLVLDVDSLPMAQNYGFVLADDNARTIASVAVVGTGNCAVRITASGALSAANRSIAYAFSGPGRPAGSALPAAWGNLRDGGTVASAAVPGEYLRAFALTMKETF